MEPFTGYRLSRNSIGEAAIPPKVNQDSSSSRNHQKPTQTRKTSTGSFREAGKTPDSSLAETTTYRLSLKQASQRVTAALRFTRPYNLKPNNIDQLPRFEKPQSVREDNDALLSILEEPKTVREDNDDLLPILEEPQTTCEYNDDDETEPYLAQFMLDERDVLQRLQTNEEINLQQTEHTEDGIDLTVKEQPSSKNEVEPKLASLEAKLAGDHEFDIIGIMNLSSMNLTDRDLPLIIQRAFRGKPKKCIGLILRDNALTSNGVKMIVDELLTPRTNLKYLSFSNNPDIGDAGIEHLVRLLQINRSITFLAIPNTGMTDRGVRMLADVLCSGDTESPCPPLEKLHISFNKLITDESLEALLQILEQNQTLKVLCLQYCGLSDKARRRLRQVGTKKKKRKFSLSD